MRPLYKPDLAKKVNTVRAELGREQRMPLAGDWYAPVTTFDPLVPQVYPLQNGFRQPADPIQQHEYRWNMNGLLEFRGHLRLPATALWQGRVAYTLPGLFPPTAPNPSIAKHGPDFRPDEDFSYTGYVISRNGLSYVRVRYHIDSTTGDVRVYPDSGLPYAAIGWFDLFGASIPSGLDGFRLNTQFGGLVLNPTKNTGFTTDDTVFDVDVGIGSIRPIEDGVYICTAVAYWDAEVTGRKITSVIWPGVRWASSGAFSEVSAPSSVTQHTEHRWVTQEGNEGFSMAASQESGSNQTLIGAAIEVTRLLSESELSLGINYP